MKRSAFQRWTQRVKQTTCEARPKPIARARSTLPMAKPAPKFDYVRDERLRDMCRAMPCQHCACQGENAGVTWAHSNQAKHGKGKGIKASDVFVAALCAICHRLVDQSTLPGLQRLSMWTAAHRRTVLLALERGIWPAGIPVPEV